MHKLYSYLRPYRAAAIAAPLLMVLEVVMDLLQPRFMAVIVNDGVMSGDLSRVGLTGLGMLAAAVVGLIGGAGCTYYAVRASMGFATDLRDALFRKVQTFAFRDLDRFTTGSLVTRLTGDVVQVQNMVQMLLRMLIRSGFLFVGSIVMALTISPRLSLLFVFAIPALFVVTFFLLRVSIPLYRDLQAKLDRVNSVLQENLGGIRVVKAFVRGAFERLRFGRANGDNFAVALKAARLMAVSSPVMTIILNVSIVCVLWFGGAMTWRSELAIGSLAAYLTYVTQALNSMVSLANTVVNISRAKASADRIGEVLETEPSMADAAETALTADASGSGPTAAGFRPAERRDDTGAPVPADSPAPSSALPSHLEFSHVSFGYEEGGEELVLQDISFAAEPGQTIGILGATGAGKSSLVGLIPRLYDPVGGRVTIGGVDVRDIPAERLRKRVGIVLQQAVLFSGTIRDNIRYGRPEATDEEIELAARAAEAHGFICSFPEGYDTVVGQRGITLSGGQKQRISIARTLLTRPDILILDDSTSAVDLRTEARIRAALKERMRGSTLLIIAQRISSVAEADRILVLEDGRIAASGTHAELMAGSAVYRDIYESQLGEERAAHA